MQYTPGCDDPTLYHQSKDHALRPWCMTRTGTSTFLRRDTAASTPSVEYCARSTHQTEHDTGAAAAGQTERSHISHTYSLNRRTQLSESVNLNQRRLQCTDSGYNHCKGEDKLRLIVASRLGVHHTSGNMWAIKIVIKSTSTGYVNAAAGARN